VKQSVASLKLQTLHFTGVHGTLAERRGGYFERIIYQMNLLNLGGLHWLLDRSNSLYYIFSVGDVEEIQLQPRS